MGDIPQEFSLQNFRPDMDEDGMYLLILERVNHLIRYDVDLLMSYLYRLDIAEPDIKKAMALDAILPANEGLARLILERQIKRMETKRKYRQDPIEGWEF